MSAPLTIQEAASVYSGLMEEVKLRLASVGDYLAQINAKPGGPDAFMKAEFCYLQIRFICELVAVAAVTANAADLSEPLPKRLMQEWQAEQIFRQLEDINKDCYPFPAAATQRDGHLHFERCREVFLERSELPEVYGRCGNALHRGSVGQLLTESRKPYDVGLVESWNRSLWQLLTHHFVFLPHLSKVLLVVLGDAKRAATVTICATDDGGDYIVT